MPHWLTFFKTRKPNDKTIFKQMSTKKRNYLKTLALKALFVPFFFLLFPSHSEAAEFGRLTIHSRQGQPLRAEVELLSVTPQEEDSLTVGLAPKEAYRKSGLDYTLAQQRLVLELVRDESRVFVRVHSAEPISEPFMSVLLELSVNDRRMGREFFLTLEPSPQTSLSSAPLSSAAIAQRNESLLSRTERARMRAPESQRSGVRFEDAQDAPARERRVVKGDTLYRIALSLERSNATLDQMLVALYRSNPDAFINNNMNLLRAGAVLSISDMNAADREVSQTEARRIVRLHTANFRQYRQRLAGMVSDAPPGKTALPGPVAEGSVAARVSERPTRVNQSPDRLELSKIRVDTPGTGFTAEEKVAMQGKIEDTNRRIVELEKNVRELRDLLTVISEGGHALTQSAKEAKEAAAKASQDAPGAESKTEKAEKEPAPQTKADEAAPQAEDSSVKEPEIKEEAPPKEKAAPVQPKPKVQKPRKAADSKAAEKPGFLSFLINSTVVRIACGIILALLALSAVWFVRRKRAAAKAGSSDAPPEQAARPEDEDPDTAAAVPLNDEPDNQNQEDTEVVELDLPGDDEVDEGALSSGIDGNALEQEPTGWDTQYVQSEEAEQTEWEAPELPDMSAMPETEPQQTEWDTPVSQDTEQDNVQWDASDREPADPDIVQGSPFVSDQFAEFENAAPEQEEFTNAFDQLPDLGAIDEAEAGEEVIVVEELVEAGPEDDWNAIMETSFSADEPEAQESPDATDGFVEEETLPAGSGSEDVTSDEDDSIKEPYTNSVASLELDLSDINLEVPAEFEEELPDMKFGEKEEDEYNPYRAEMEDKLELAMAYVDMKDREGAIELLEEIIERGTAKQIELAKKALDSL